MNLYAVAWLKPWPETRVWYRVVGLGYLSSALATTHTSKVASRFNAGDRANPPFEILYLAENPVVAMYEAQALAGTVTMPGRIGYRWRNRRPV